MKRTVLIVMILISCLSLQAQKSKGKHDPKGLWKFENTSAPGGYSTGTVEIKYAKKVYSVLFTFPSVNEAYKAEDVSFMNDSLKFSLTVQGMQMTCRSKFEQADVIAGETLVMGNAVPFLITRDKSGKKTK